jgi:tRNA nucleotidyltransferase (CCA-adding enzyme)
MPATSPEDIGAAMRRAYPELGSVRAAARDDEPVFLVGGSVRDLLLERDGADLDLVVIGDAGELAERLGDAGQVERSRFATAKAIVEGREVDLATAREESYPRPGALPEVRPAATIEADLERRDFTVNAMAIPLLGEPALIDPHGGVGDLEAGLLRILHPASFADDPIRAIRAARYASRFGFDLEPGTAAALRATDLETVSEDRRRAELLRLAGEDAAARGFELLAEWGLIALVERGGELAAGVARLLEDPGWAEMVSRPSAVLRAAIGPAVEVEDLIAESGDRPSRALALARGRDAAELAIARVRGALWIDRFVGEWRAIALEIDGNDLIAAGVPRGPAVGLGLAAARDARIDGEASGRPQELAVALAAARGATAERPGGRPA